MSGRAQGVQGAAIVGIAVMPLHDGRVIGDYTELGVQAQCVKTALADAGIAKDEVDGLLVSGSWPGRSGKEMSLALAEYLGIVPTFTDSTNIGGASFEAHVGHAAAAIAAGQCRVAVVCYGSLQRSSGFRRKRAENPEPYFGEQYISPLGLPVPVGAYALAAQRYLHDYGATSEQLAEVAVAARGWAALNPDAMYRDPLTVEDVVHSDLIATPLHKLDCCLVTDGGGALVLVGPERARDVRTRPIWVLGQAEAHTHLYIHQMRDLTESPAAVCGPLALKRSGLSLADIDVVELYDSFTITVLLQLEALGFCGRGEAADLVMGGRIAPGGSLALNTGGGGLSCCHPGMYGIFLLTEAVRQLRGERGEGQVAGARTALVSGMGGTLSSAGTVVLASD